MKWLDPVYKKLAASELGIGHTYGIVPARETSSYFGESDANESHLIKEITIEFWCGDRTETIKTNVNWFVSSTHHHIHITGNLLAAYQKYDAQPGDVLVFWRSVEDDKIFKAELIKPGSERWDLILAKNNSFPRVGGFLKLEAPEKV
jgi:hypothetical protein